MADPTIYFPAVHYEMFEGGIQWNTLVNKSASGRRSQVRLKGGDDPLRLFACRVSFFDEDGATLPLQTTFNEDVATIEEFFRFLRTIKGQWRRFFIFNPKRWNVHYRVSIEVDADGVTLLGSPFTFPVRFGQIDTTLGLFPDAPGDEPGPVLTDWFPYIDDDYTTPVTLTLTVDPAGGTGKEWVLSDTPTPPTLAVGVSPGFHWFTFPFVRANERIAMRFQDDRQPFQFDPEMADPPHSITLQMMEDDGTDDTP